ncbi:MAG: hypothetical protein HZC24_14150 [Rhodocyclales bacterium]|nr:hypothetical protein [Rhodocyclales bacterium]
MNCSNLIAGRKWPIVFPLLLALVMSACVLALVDMTNGDALAHTMESRFPDLRIAGDIVKRSSESDRLVRDALLAGTADEVAANIRHVMLLHKLNRDAGEKIRSDLTAGGTEEIALLDVMQAQQAALARKYEPLFALLHKPDAAAAKAYFNAEYLPAQKACATAQKAFAAYREGLMSEARQETAAEFRTVRAFLITLALLIAVAGTGAALAMSGTLGARDCRA